MDLNVLTQKMCNVIIKIHFVVSLHISYFLLHPSVTFICVQWNTTSFLSPHTWTHALGLTSLCVYVWNNSMSSVSLWQFFGYSEVACSSEKTACYTHTRTHTRKLETHTNTGKQLEWQSHSHYCSTHKVLFSECCIDTLCILFGSHKQTVSYLNTGDFFTFGRH